MLKAVILKSVILKSVILKSVILKSVILKNVLLKNVLLKNVLVKSLVVACGTAIGAFAFVQAADACSRILWNDNKLAVVVSRTMDWPESTEPKLVVFPRGTPRDGGRVGNETVVAQNAAKWTSKFGSLVTSVYGIGAVDGVNERGLGIHLLYLTATDFGPRDASKPGIHAGLWGQYLLDNAESVAEALKLLDGIQIVMAEARGRKATVHLAMEDASGDSAIVEYIDGKPVVHHGREYRIMTNDPTYDQQLALLKQQDFSKPSSEMTLPGNVNARDRFQRAAYYSALLPEPKNQREAIAGVLAIARNVSVPFGAPYKGFGIYNTEYRTAIDLTNRRYFFELTTSPNVIWADLMKFDLSPGAPVRELDPDNIDLSGEVNADFRPLTKAPF
ncbi:linear amide C-N hydrolase [Pseudorhodoplanes sp.]|uniref:linear amide C-N hydrolase n=1 Tax=Pseudorhodoplanes sp. TaxID=1934341 RepID=UPI00391CFBC9